MSATTDGAAGRVELGRWLAFALRMGLGALFLVAGGLKLRDPVGFATEISNYHLLPAAAPWLAATLPAVELVVGLTLLIGTRTWLRAAALCTIGLMAVFTVAVTQVVARGINVSCGCFGGGDSGPVTLATVARDVVLLAAAVLLLRLSPPEGSAG
jgi:uncharacterized membrane protein YphA (DoxX/SURF4 family)